MLGPGITRTDSPGFHGQNIAPQHMFDSLSDTFASPSLPAFSLRQPSPSASVNGNAAHLDFPSQDNLHDQNQRLRTRVSELEVREQLYKSRVEELERDAKEAERRKNEESERVKSELEVSSARVVELERKLNELEGQSSPARKRARRATVEAEEEAGQIS
jgi:GATA-binding protein